MAIAQHLLAKFLLYICYPNKRQNHENFLAVILNFTCLLPPYFSFPTIVTVAVPFFTLFV